MSKLVCKNPGTGEILKEIDITPENALPAIFDRAKKAQISWSELSLKKRARHLRMLRETMLNHVDELAALISAENGKPLFESLMNEIFTSVDLLTFFAKRAPRILKNQTIPLVLMKHRKSYVQHWPLGVVVVISPWNYPLLLPFGEIVMALVAGNAVVFKPSEATPLVGLKIQELCEEAGLPPGLIQTVVGDGNLGAALIQQKPAKIFFTGSVSTGKKIMAAAAEHLIPVNLELGGKDAMVILPDADLDFASSAALWGGFSNSGQVCASVERILVHESIAELFMVKLKEKVTQLRQAPSTAVAGNDLGAITLDKQKTTYDQQISQAKQAGAHFLTGGAFSSDLKYLIPTLVTGEKIESLEIYNEETFGPVVAITTFKTPAEAVRKVNSSSYGLLASVITKNIALGEQIARQLEVGTVTINEVTYTCGLPETPWGGIKNSGIGRTHSERGLLEFVNVRHIHKPKSRLFVFKSPWWFPYTPYQYKTFRTLLELYRLHWTDRLKALPHVLWNLVKFLKEEKRL